MAIVADANYPLIGVGYRRAIAPQLLEAADKIDCLEILVEHFLPLTNRGRSELAELRERFILIPHGVSMSLGSQSPECMPHLSDLQELIALIQPMFFGEHLSMSRTPGIDLWHLSPVWRTKAQLKYLVSNVRRATALLGVPLVLETITEMLRLPLADYEMDEFLAELCEQTGAGVLLDLTNVLINSTNGTSSELQRSFGRLSSCRWDQFHIVGYATDHDGYLIDSHDAPIQPELLQLYSAALEIQTPRAVIIERDGEFSAQPTLMDEVATIRALTSRRHDECIGVQVRGEDMSCR